MQILESRKSRLYKEKNHSIKNEKEFYKKFKPQLTPKKMLELGVFGGAYFVDGSIKEFPQTWFTKAKISKTFDVNLNRFKIESGLSRKEWIDKCQ